MPDDDSKPPVEDPESPAPETAPASEQPLERESLRSEMDRAFGALDRLRAPLSATGMLQEKLARLEESGLDSLKTKIGWADSLVTPAATAYLQATQSCATFSDHMVRAMAPFHNATKRFADFAEETRRLLAPYESLNSATRSFTQQWALGETSALGRMAEMLKSQLGMSQYELMFERLPSVVFPSAWLLANARLQELGSFGVLAGLSDGATLSWADATEVTAEPVVHAAVLRPEAAPSGRPTVNVRVRVQCALCRTLMFVPGSSQEWLSDVQLELTLNVAPVCAKCIHGAAGPEYWLEKLDHLGRPELKLIPGGGKNSGDGTGERLPSLRLVSADEVPKPE